MALTTRVEPIDRDVDLMIRETLSPQAQSAILADAAREQLAAGEQQNEHALGTVPTHRTFVDGSEGADEDRVRPEGTIVYEFDIVADMFGWIADQLEQHSPRKSGRFAKSHTFYADGVEADPKAPPPDAQEYVFLSLAPYARKIEQGLSHQAPDGVYEAVAVLARRRFGNSAKIDFTHRSANGGDLGQWAASTTALRHARAHHRVSNPQDWLTRQPAIVITLR